MKRFWHEHHFRQISGRLAKKSHARKLRSKQKRKRRNRLKQGLSKKELKARNKFKNESIGARFPRAPRQMCFLKNPDGMAAFIHELSKSLESRTPVFVDMQFVEDIELNAITVLLAVMVQFKSKGIKFNGSIPRGEQSQKVLKESRFFDHLNGRYPPKESYDLPGASIYTHGKLSVDSDFSQDIINAASKTVWGMPRRCPGVQRTFIELMQNTNNHASIGKSGEKHWWISVQHVQDERRVVFCFVDFGVGVFQSLANKPASNVFHKALEKVKQMFRVTRNEEVLKLIFEGELHKTVTGYYYRGKGLPGIYSVLQKNGISNLAMITNDVYFNSKEGIFRKLNTSFSGTFISWELSTNNTSLPNEN
jgi:hypothetical protein